MYPEKHSFKSSSFQPFSKVNVPKAQSMLVEEVNIVFIYVFATLMLIITLMISVSVGNP
ncbi:hypothetical protein Hanom_Chr09g00835731 [Helianthus anomalus]